MRSEKIFTSHDWLVRWTSILSRQGKLVALKTSAGPRSYQELGIRAQATSDALLASSSWKPGMCVAIPSDDDVFLERCVGIWLAHGVVVPFNPTHCAKDAALREVIERIIDLSFDDRIKPRAPSAFLSTKDRQDTPYHAVFFTSGTTGHPRAIVRGWTQALSEAEQYISDAGLQAGSTTTMLIDPAFGASTKHLVGCLLSGSSLRFLSVDQEISEASDVLYLTPSHAQSVQVRAVAQRSARVVSLTGEYLSQTGWLKTKHLLRPDGFCLNAVGGSEFGVISNEIIRASCEGPVGRGLPSKFKNILIVDEDGVKLPPGVPGLVQVSSHSLAEGYIDLESGLPQLSPFPTTAEGRAVFTTSDVGVVHESGELEIIGRRNDMVKRAGRWLNVRPLRNFVENFEGITGCAIDNDPHSSSIRLWVEGLIPPSTEFQNLVTGITRTFLGSPLLPSQCIGLRQFPRNRHGKVDLKALKAGAAQKHPAHHFGSSADVLAELICNPEATPTPLETGVSLTDLGIDSLVLHELALTLARRLKKQVALSELLLNLSISELGRRLRETDSMAPVRVPSRALPRCRLIWLGDGIGSLQASVPSWCEILHWDMERIVPEDARSCLQPMPRIVQRLVAEIRGCSPDLPTFVGGFSFGAFVAAFVAAAMEGRPSAPRAIFMVDPPRMQLDAIRKSILVGRSHLVWLGSLLIPTRLMPSASHRLLKEARRRALGAHFPSRPHGSHFIFCNRRYLPSTSSWAETNLKDATIMELPTKEHLAVVLETSISRLWTERVASEISARFCHLQSLPDDQGARGYGTDSPQAHTTG